MCFQLEVLTGNMQVIRIGKKDIAPNYCVNKNLIAWGISIKKFI